MRDTKEHRSLGSGGSSSTATGSSSSSRTWIAYQARCMVLPTPEGAPGCQTHIQGAKQQEELCLHQRIRGRSSQATHR